MPVRVAWPAHFYQPSQWLAAGTWLTCPLRHVARHVPGSIIRFTSQMTPQRGPGQRRRRAPAASAARRRTPGPGWHQKPFGSCASCTACTEPAASCEPSTARGRRRQTSRRTCGQGRHSRWVGLSSAAAMSRLLLYASYGQNEHLLAYTNQRFSWRLYVARMGISLHT